MEQIFYYKKKRIKITIKKCNFFQKISGLMLTRKQKAKALFFEFKKPIAIHSFFVFFPFIAIWLDKNDKIIEIKKIKPFTFHVKPKKNFTKIIEIPINKKYKDVLKLIK